MKNMKTSQGFTLIELLVYVVVLSVVVIIIMNIFLWVVRSNTKTRVIRETTDNVRIALDTMGLEIRQASSLYTPTMTASSQLSLVTTGNLPVDETSTYVDFFLCGTRLCIKRESQNPSAVTSDNVEVVNLDFSEVTTASTQSVYIAIQVDYKNPNNKEELEASFTATSTTSMRSY